MLRSTIGAVQAFETYAREHPDDYKGWVGLGRPALDHRIVALYQALKHYNFCISDVKEPGIAPRF
jgi:hypothetical protein